METRHDLEHTTERLTEGLRCPMEMGSLIGVEIVLLGAGWVLGSYFFG